MELFKTLFYWVFVGSKKSLSLKLIGLALLSGNIWNINYFDKNLSFGLSTNAGNETLSWIIALCGILLLALDFIHESKKKAIIIQHTGIAEIPTMDIDSARPIWDKAFKANTINIECDRFYKNGIVTDPEEMLRQTKSIKESIENNTRKTNPEYLKLYYGGLVQVPFAFLAGVIFENTKPVEVYDWDRTQEKWYRIQELKNSKTEINIQHPESVVNRLAIEIAISYDINRQNTIEAVGNIPVLKMQAKIIKRDNAKDIESQKYIADEFHKILDKYNNVDEIHIFIATQNSMVFNLGRQVSKRVHSTILVWQYEGQNNVNNPWAVDVFNENIYHKNK